MVCFEPSAVERFGASRLAKNEALARLGPDLLGDDVDWTEILRRARAHTGTAGTLLLDQTVAAGLGNVYRSELLFLEGVHPDTPAADLGDAVVEALYQRARTLLQANVATGHRRTTPRSRGPRGPGASDEGSALWVYGRSGRPCLRCGTDVGSAPHGRHARVVFWCPTCQPVP